MSDSSDAQMVVFGSYGLGAGLLCIFKPEISLFLFKPLTSVIEKLTGLAPIAVASQGPMIASFGSLASAIGLYYLVAVRSKDEKFKKNTVVGRYFFALLCLANSFTPRGNSFLAAVGLVDAIAASIMGMTVGFGGASADTGVSKRS